MLTIDAKAFSKATKNALSAIRKTPMPIYESLLFQFFDGKMKVTGANSEFQVAAFCDAGVGSEGAAFCLSADRIRRIVADSGEVKIQVSDGRVAIKTAVGRYQVATLPAEDYPVLEKQGEGGLFPASLIAQVFHAAADRDVRYYLNGVHVFNDGQRVCVEASDGHRAARVYAESGGLPAFNVIIPRDAAKQISALGTVSAAFMPGFAVFSTDDMTITTKLCEGNFPDLDRVFPSHPRRIVINRDETLAALRAVVGCADEKFSGVLLDTSGGDAMRFSVKNEADTAESQVAGTGDFGLSVGVNIHYLIEAVAAQGENIEISWADSASSMIFGGSKIIEVIMPMKV